MSLESASSWTQILGMEIVSRYCAPLRDELMLQCEARNIVSNEFMELRFLIPTHRDEE